MKIIQRYFFLFLNENISCDPTLEPSKRDGSNDVSQNMFYGEILLIIPSFSLLPLLIWSTETQMQLSGPAVPRLERRLARQKDLISDEDIYKNGNGNKQNIRLYLTVYSKFEFMPFGCRVSSL